MQQSRKEIAELRNLIARAQQRIAQSLARLCQPLTDQVFSLMPLTNKIHTVLTGDHTIHFRLETQTRLGMVEGPEKECTYICEECEHFVATFVGIPGKTPIPADVLESMIEHSRKHQERQNPPSNSA